MWHPQAELPASVGRTWDWPPCLSTHPHKVLPLLEVKKMEEDIYCHLQDQAELSRTMSYHPCDVTQSFPDI